MYDRIITACRDAVWCITESKLDEIWTFLDRASAGVAIDGESLKLLVASRRERTSSNVQKAVGVLPIVGTISHRANMLEEASGGISTQQIGRDFDTLMASDQVGSILLDIDSPGGTYPGIPELAEKIFAARGTKPVIAQVSPEAASGGYWLASAASEVVMMPSGSVGSIGAYLAHDDASELNEAIGVKRSYISYGKYKTEGNTEEPLSDETRQFLQDRVDKIGQEFESAVAKFRGVPVSTVRKDFGQGRMLNAKAAVAAGMADSIGTMEDTVARLASGKGRSRGLRVENARRLMDCT